MGTRETDVEIGADGCIKLLSPLPSWLKQGRVHLLLTLTSTEVKPGTPSGIEKVSQVDGGDACIAGTRIPVYVLKKMLSGEH